MPLVNGLYRASFKTDHGSDRTVVMIENGRISGGDSRLFYEGSLISNGENFTAVLRVAAHFDVPAVAGILGGLQASFEISGVCSGSGAICSGVSAGPPEIPFDAVLSLLRPFEDR